MGSAGGNGYHYHQTSSGKPQDSGRGGGLVVLGAKTLKVQAGGLISANGIQGGYGSGGGAGGTIALFVENLDNQGTIRVNGGGAGPKDNGNESSGGVGGVGWLHQKQPITGIINESYPKQVEIWVDGNNVTASVGDPNGKGSPHWNAANKSWGATGLEPWSTGPLDLTNVANWTLGEHTIEFKEKGGAGGLMEAYVYVIYPFTASKPPANDTCTAPKLIDPNDAPVVIAGSTEDTMGKVKATDASQQAGCGGIAGPDLVYQINLKKRSLIHAAVVSSFSAKLYIRETACSDGKLTYCGDQAIDTNPVEPGTYYLWVDSDNKLAKGDFTLTVSTTPAELPSYDTCATPMVLDFAGGTTVSHSGTNKYSLDQYKGLCPAAKTGGPDVVYEFQAATGKTLTATLTAPFESILYVMTSACGTGVPLACSGSGTLTIQGLAGGKYWLFVDGTGEKEWGAFTLDLEVK
jgi:hypothetical protein